MKLGSAVGLRDDPASFARHLQALEKAGVDYLWCGEAYTADAVSTMGPSMIVAWPLPPP